MSPIVCGTWKGIFAIPVTPFLSSGEIDYASLDRQVEFCIGGGAHGIVYPGVVSEFFTLSEQERSRTVEQVIKTVAGRIPTVVGVSATSTPVAVGLAAHAASVGASGVMATLPYVQHFFAPDATFINHYFAAVAAESGLPVILQNARIGHAISMGGLKDVIAANPAIRYLKEETAPCTLQLSAAISAVGQEVDGVFAGLGGVYLMSELDRGAVGSMPAPPFVDVLARAYELHTGGQREEARRRLAPLASLFTFELLYNVAVIKEVLVRRGVIAGTTCRTPAPALDAVDQREISELLELIAFDELSR